MSSAQRESAAQSRPEAGTVEVRRDLTAPADKVWRALTDPSAVAAWFGNLSAPLDGGGNVRLEFGDGDFFLLEDIQLNPPHSLQYSWRFLGIGPLDTIRWTLVTAGNHCAVTVTDRESERSAEEALQLGKGWLDFTRRLRDYLQKGKTTRYAWRHDFDGSIELPCDIERVRAKLLSRAAQSRWLPLPDGAALEAGASFDNADGGTPSRLVVTSAEWGTPHSISFRLAGPDWERPTECQLKLSARSRGALLSVSHTGWRAISADRDYQKQQRRRFCDFWISLLVKARCLVTQDASS